MQKITPFLWFLGNAEEAINCYQETFVDFELVSLQEYPAEVPDLGGKVMSAEFKIGGLMIDAFDAGEHDEMNPSISFFVETTRENADKYWEGLSKDGEVLMELQKYDWSEYYGWVQDRFGMTWQIAMREDGKEGEKVTPSFLFTNKNFGKAKAALEFYADLFPNSSVDEVVPFAESVNGVDTAIMWGSFTLADRVFYAMDSGMVEHDFGFNDAISLFVSCQDQEEVDKYWHAFLEAGGKESMCGWLKDQFGVSWQIIPTRLMELLQHPDAEKAQKANEAMLKMKKIEISQLEAAVA